MKKEPETKPPEVQELSEDDIEIIHQAFDEKVVPRLQQLDARIGNLNCSFAGDKYSKWVVSFRPVGSGFEIVEIEYDPDTDQFDLDL